MDEIYIEIPVVPVVDTAIYASGDRVGSVMTFAGAARAPGESARVVGVRIVDNATQKSALNLWLFKATPTVASADNAPLDITDANLALAQAVGFVAVVAADYVDTASNAVAFHYLAEPGLPFTAGAGDGSSGVMGPLYGLLEAAGTPTYGAANALTVTLIVCQEG